MLYIIVMSLPVLYQNLISRLNRKPRTLTVATDCSGIEAPLMALDLMKIPYQHIFSSEIDRNCVQFITNNFPPSIIYDDIKKRDNRLYQDQPLDLYIAGFPCQTFSSLGSGKGFLDQTKGTIFFYVYDFISHNRPNIFILENVRTLKTHNKGQTFQTIMDTLKQLPEYQIKYMVLDTKDYGIPQSRNRLFIVGIKQNILAHELQVPPTVSSPIPLENLLERGPPEPLSARHQALMTQIEAKYPEIDFYHAMWILNLNVSSIQWFRRGQVNIAPCIVTSSKYYIPSYHRYLYPTECLRLQGIPIRKYDFDFGDNILRKFAGNTISINVIMSLLIEVFNSVRI